jgi:outer membrane immunogenic protein
MRNRLVALLAAAASLGAAPVALAADLPVKAPPPAAVVAATWSGIYVGITAGGTWGLAEDIANDPGLAGNGLLISSQKPSGFVGGGTVGANWQTGSIVLGVEGDWSWTNKRSSAFLLPPFNVTTNLDIKERWIATARGRAGFAYDRWLFYVTGGAAWARVEQILSNAILAVTVSNTKTLVG